MTDGELREVAEDARSLSDVAKQALREEIARRRLDIGLNETVPPGAPPGPVVLRRYVWLRDALAAKMVLDSAGVECLLADEHIIRMDAFYSPAFGGVKPWVRAEDADAAELLEQGWVESFMVSGVGQYVQPRCPHCRSFEISYKGLLRRLAYMSLLGFWLTGVVPPIALHDLAWRCHSCGHVWEEGPDVAEPAKPGM